MKLLRSFPAVALLVVLLGIVAFFTASRSVGMLLVTGVLAVLSWYVTEGPRGRALPTWVSNLLIMAVWLNFAVELLQQRLDILGALGRLIVWMSVIKLYQRKAPRDYAQLLTLSVLLVVLGAVRSTDLLFAALLLLYAAAALYALLLYQLYAAYERSRRARAADFPAGAPIVASIQPIIGRRVGLHLRSLMGAIGIGGVVTSTVLFAAFPRQLSRGGSGDGTGRRGPAESGFAEEVTLGASTMLSASRRVVMTVALEGGQLAGGQPLRLRGAVLDRYEGSGHWVSNPTRDIRPITTSTAGPLPLGPVPRAGPLITQHVELLEPGHTLFAAWAPVALSTDKPGHFAFDTALTIRSTGAGRHRSYTVRSDPDPDDATMRALYDGLADPPDRAVPRSIPAQVRDLARDLLRGRGLSSAPPATLAARDEFRIAAARLFTDHLRSGRFTYTTDLRDVVIRPDQDPIAQFLFETHRGHCEYYASALAALCLSAGVPARLVTGFVALEYDEGAGHYIVRAANAHAWVEVLTGERRWTTFDPTPPGTLQELHSAKNTLSDRLHWFFDRFDSAWHNEFVSFDRNSQERLLSRLDFDWTARLGELAGASLQWMSRLNRRFYLGPAGYIWMGLVALAGIVALVALARHLRRVTRLRAAVGLTAARGAASRRALHQLGFYLDMLTVLRRAGLAKPAWQPPLAFAESLAERGHAAAAAPVRRIAHRFYAARYGNRLRDRRERTEMQALVGELSSALRGQDGRGHPQRGLRPSEDEGFEARGRGK